MYGVCKIHASTVHIHVYKCVGGKRERKVVMGV